MKKIRSVLIFIMLSSPFLSQAQYYDALELRKYFIRDTLLFINDNNLPLLKRCYPSVNSDEICDYIKDLKENPFLKGFDIKCDSLPRELAGIGQDKGFMTKLGKIDVTTFSQGLSSFLITRAKEELNVAFFQKFKDYCENENHIEIKTLFPITTGRIGSLLAYQYAQMLPVLQEAFQLDMQNLDHNMINLLLMPEYYDVVKNKPEFLVLLNLFSVLAQINNNTPPELINQLSSITRFKDTSLYKLHGIQNLHTALSLTTIISNSLVIALEDPNASDNYWIPFGEFSRSILSDPIATRLYLGLLYEQIEAKQLKFNGISLSAQLSKNTTQQEIYWYTNWLSKVIVQFDLISSAANNVKTDNGSEMTAHTDQVNCYFKTTLGLMEIGIEMAAHFNQQADEDMQYISLVRHGSELVRNTFCRNYSLAVDNALAVLEIINRIPGSNSTSMIDERTMTAIITYGRFIGNVASAKEPADVEKAINAIALPTGSSSLKKYHHNNVAINAYLGLCTLNHTAGNSTSNTWKNSIGLTAPVGINWAVISMQKGGSLSVFAPLLDIGAIVDYQLSDSTHTSFDQRIYLENILSPGLYIVYGFGQNMPLALSFGGQYGPGLTSIGHNLKKPTWRWNLTLTVDIPMINLNAGRRKMTKK